MQTLHIEDLENLGRGCAILGSGGGGDPTSEILIARYAMEQFGPVSLIDLEELKDDDWILPIGVIGAPLVGLEKLRSGREFHNMLAFIEKYFGKKPTVLMPVEIGGANGFAPLSVAAQEGLPVLNGDLMGRAFPQLQMTTGEVVGISLTPAILADSVGNTVLVEARNAQELEKMARQLAVSMGSSAAIGFCLMNKEEALRAVIPNTFSQAIEIGSKQQVGQVLGEGTIVSIDQRIENGFLQGGVQIRGEDGIYEIRYQNEYLFLEKDRTLLASTPDILMLIESSSFSPITTESLRYGLKVSIVKLPAPPIWQTEKGLKLVGPEQFGGKICTKSV